MIYMFGVCDIFPIAHHKTSLQTHTLQGYFMSIVSSLKIFKWWYSNRPLEIHYFSMARFDEYINILPDGSLSPGSLLMQG